jgi:hypothetical protein
MNSSLWTKAIIQSANCHMSARGYQATSVACLTLVGSSPGSRHRGAPSASQLRVPLGNSTREHNESALPRKADLRVDVPEVRVGPSGDIIRLLHQRGREA